MLPFPKPVSLLAYETACPDATAHHVFIALAIEANPETLLTAPNLRRLSQRLGRSKTVIRDAISRLVETGLLDCMDIRRGQSTVYRLVLVTAADGEPTPVRPTGWGRPAHRTGSSGPPDGSGGAATGSSGPPDGVVRPTGRVPSDTNPSGPPDGVVRPTGRVKVQVRTGRDVTQKPETAPPTPPTMSVEAFGAQWNAIDGIAHVRRITPKRRTALQARLRDYTYQEVEDALGRIARSRFCKGQNDRGWKATIDWFCRPDTIVKLLEGQYDASDRRGTAAIRAAPGKYDHIG